MKIAYLILAHENPQHLQRLIRALRTPWTRFYVHVDTKVPAGLFDGLRGEPQTALIEDRVSACWGGYSLVQATLNLMAAAIRDPEPADWYVLLSGAHYPIRSNEEIRDYLQRSNSEHIGCMPMPSPDGRKPLARLETVYFEQARGQYKPIRVLLSQTNRFLARFYKRNYRKALGSLVPYAGSQWWALSHDAVRYILDFVDRQADVVRFYKRSDIPDEMFFQTILGNSPFKNRIARGFTYADWSQGPKRNPLPLTHEHIDRFADGSFALDDVEGRGPCFFARKFTADDGALLDRIDAWRGKISDRELGELSRHAHAGGRTSYASEG